MALRTQAMRTGACSRATAPRRAVPLAVSASARVATPSLRLAPSPSLTPRVAAPRAAAARPSRAATVAVRAQAAAAPAQPFKWGADMKNLAICVGVAAALWFAPPPAGVTVKAWHLLSLFVGTILGIITTPLPLGAVAILGLGATMLTKTLTFAQAFSAFASEIP